MTISGTMILRPVTAMDMTMASRSANGSESAFGYRIIDDRAYVSFGPDLWLETAAADAKHAVDAFKPETFMASFGSLEGLEPVGDETKNGISTTRRRGKAPASIGSMFGMPTGTWTAEVWIARDGGYLVSGALTGEAPDGRFTMSVDISDLDSGDSRVEPPASFTPMGG